MQIGLIGCGRIGYVHALSIDTIENSNLLMVSDPLVQNAERIANRFDAQMSSSDEIIASDAIDAIIIATPTPTHYDLIKSACEAGKAIFCEKPMDLDSNRIRKSIGFIESANVPFMTAFNRRFDKNFANIKARISDGHIGDVEILTILSRDPSPPPIDYIKSSGGIFKDMMIHDFDMARFLLGEEFISVHAVGSALVDPEIGKAGDVDTAAVTMTTESGKICQISNSRRATYGYDQRVEVHGSKGMLRAGNILENTVELSNASGIINANTEHFFLERYKEAYISELRYFVETINAGTPLCPSALDGLKAQLLAEAAERSMQNGEVTKPASN